MVLLQNLLDLDFNIHACGQIESHQGVDSFTIGIEYVDKTLVGTNFKMLLTCFMNET